MEMSLQNFNEINNFLNIFEHANNRATSILNELLKGKINEIREKSMVRHNVNYRVLGKDLLITYTMTNDSELILEVSSGGIKRILNDKARSGSSDIVNAMKEFIFDSM